MRVSVAVLCLLVAACQAEDNAWQRVPLGSWLECEVDDGEQARRLLRATVLAIDADGRVQVEVRRLPGREWDFGAIAHGPTLARADFTAGPARSEEADIAGARLACAVTEWTRAEAPSAGDTPAPARPLRLTLRTWSAAALAVPARTLTLASETLVLPANVARCEWVIEGTVSSQRIESRIVARDRATAVGAETVPCLVEELRTAERDGDGAWEADGAWERLLSERVPGGQVALTTITAPILTAPSSWRATGFHRAPPFDPAAELRALRASPPAQRPVVPDPGWAGQRVGAWVYEIGLATGSYGGDRPRQNLHQVLAVRPDGSWIEWLRDDLDGGRTSLRLHLPPRDPPHGRPLEHPTWPARHEDGLLVRTGEREIDWNGERVACEWALYRAGDHRRLRDVRLYRPRSGPLRERLERSGHGWLMRTSVPREHGLESAREERVVAWDVAIRIGGVERHGVRVESVQRGESKGSERRWALLSTRVPGGVLAEYEHDDRYGETQEWRLIAAHGALEDAPPAALDGRALGDLAGFAPVPFANNPYAGAAIGTEVVYRVEARVGTESGGSRLCERVEGGTWLGLPVLRSYRLEADAAILLESRMANLAMDPVPQLTAGEARTEELMIGGRGIPCTRRTWSGSIGREKWTLERWIGDAALVPYRESAFGAVRVAVPAGTLKERSRIDCGSFVLSIEREVTALDEAVNAAGSERRCAVEDWRVSATGGLKVSHHGTLWLDGGFPGHRVRSRQTTANPGAPEEVIEQTAEAVTAPTPTEAAGTWAGVAAGGWVEFAVEGGAQPGPDPHGRRYRLRLAGASRGGAAVVAVGTGHPDFGAMPQSWTEAPTPAALLAPGEAATVTRRWDGADRTGTRTAWTDAADNVRLETIVLEGVATVVAPVQLGGIGIALPAGCTEAELVVLQESSLLRVRRTLLPDTATTTVGDRVLTCRRDRLVYERVDPKTGDGTEVFTEQRWLSTEVPGAVVRCERSEPGDGKRRPPRVVAVTAFARGP